MKLRAVTGAVIGAVTDLDTVTGIVADSDAVTGTVTDLDAVTVKLIEPLTLTAIGLNSITPPKRQRDGTNSLADKNGTTFHKHTAPKAQSV